MSTRRQARDAENPDALDFGPGFFALTGRQPATVEALRGGASSRRYFRVGDSERHSGCRFVVMVLAPEPVRAAEGRSPQVEAGPFLEMQALLAAGGVAVPTVHRHDPRREQIWLDDLGDRTLKDVLVDAEASTERLAWYSRALAVLTDFQKATTPERVAGAGCAERRFTEAQMRWELEHYVEWRLEAQLGVHPSDAWRSEVDAAFEQLVAALTALPHRVAHRDFQSTNLMLTGSGESEQLVLIDFQDAWMAPMVYDHVALLRDSYIILDAAELDALLPPDAAFRRAFHLQTVQRKLKDAGRFVFFEHHGKPGYLPFVESTLAMVRDAFAALPELAELHARLAEYDPALRPGRGETTPCTR